MISTPQPRKQRWTLFIHLTMYIYYAWFGCILSWWFDQFFNTSSRVWRSFSTAMTSKRRTFAKSSSAPKAEDTMVSRGFIVNLVSFVSVVIMKRLRLLWSGTIFSCSTVLGARLHSTVESSSCVEDVENKTKEEKKAAVSASFTSPFISGSAGASYANETEDGKGFKIEDKSGRMNWEARGGTTFLAVEWVRKWCPTDYWKYISLYDSPPSWINTVGTYQNWRVIEVSWIFTIWCLLDKEYQRCVLYSVTAAA